MPRRALEGRGEEEEEGRKEAGESLRGTEGGWRSRREAGLGAESGCAGLAAGTGSSPVPPPGGLLGVVLASP